MARFKHSLALLISIQIGLSNAAWAAGENYLKAGMNGYFKGNYNLAKAQLEVAVNKEPKNQKAHYFLALVLTQLHDNKGATDSYQKCISLDPASECGIKAKEGLAHHQAYQQKNTQRIYKAIRQDRVDTSSERLANQIEHELNANDEANKKLAKQKLEEADKEAERIQEQAKEEMNSLPRLRRNGYWRGQMRQQIQEQAKQRITDLKKRAKEQAEQLDKDSANRQESMKDMLSGLHNGLNNPNAKGTRLRPEGTNANVRNYEHKP